MTRIAIAGATGFVGRALCARLASEHAVVGLSREPPADAGVPFRRCDLFSLLDAERGLADIDVAIYALQPMRPSARLAQGEFRDTDLLLADNFARAARRQGVRRIILVQGLPQAGDEVERTLRDDGVPLTALRVPMLIGAGGQLTSALVKLVRRLPAMLLPSWTRTPLQPLAIADLAEAVAWCVREASSAGRGFDLGGPEVTTWRGLLEQVGDLLGKRRPMFDVPLSSPTISKLWIRAFTPVPRAYVDPMVDGLGRPRVAHRDPLRDEMGIVATPLSEALRVALEGPAPRHRPRPRQLDVRSVQRLMLPPGRDADWVAQEYMRWLPQALAPLIAVDRQAEGAAWRVVFRTRGLVFDLLKLRWSPERSWPDRSLLYVVGGQLARVEEGDRGRLEFRRVLDGRFLLAAIHEFRPRLPWWFYTVSQAWAHLWVMHAFGRHLARLSHETPETDYREETA